MIAFFSSIKLTFTQWLLLTAAAVIGYLVIALRLKGGALQKAQIELLSAHWENIDKADEEAVAKVKAALTEAAKGL